MRAFLESNRASLPEYREEIEMLVAAGDFVAWRSVGSGTQTGQVGPFAPSGRRMSIVIIGMHRFGGGRIAETWTSWDNTTAARRLGFLPAGPGA